MKKCFRLAVVASLLGLVCFAASASAECAWVLWTTRLSPYVESSMPESMSPSGAFLTKAECSRTMERGRAMDDASRKQGSKIRSFFTCLPDTVDPRGPKGGK